MARMLGLVRPPWCPSCKAPPGPDCPDVSRSPRQVRAAERREVTDAVWAAAAEMYAEEIADWSAAASYVSALWWDDWGSVEDAAYDDC